MTAQKVAQFVACLAVCLGVSLSSAAEPWDRGAANMFEDMVSATYCKSTEKIEDRFHGNVAPGTISFADGHNSARIMIGKLTKQSGCFLAFRAFPGSDAQLKPYDKCPTCEVPVGLSNLWDGLEAGVIQGLKAAGCEAGAENNLFVTGHSLGGALAYLAMFPLSQAGFNIKALYLFDSPRVGNPAFSKNVMSTISKTGNVFRIHHDESPAQEGYTRIEEHVYYMGQTNISDFKVCESPWNPKCKDQDWGIRLCSSWLTAGRDICEPQGCDTPTRLV